MLFLHIVPPSKRMMNTYFRMLREHFPLEEHRFLFIDQCKESESELFDYENVGELQGENSKERLKDFFRECCVMAWDHVRSQEDAAALLQSEA